LEFTFAVSLFLLWGGCLPDNTRRFPPCTEVSRFAYWQPGFRVNHSGSPRKHLSPKSLRSFIACFAFCWLVSIFLQLHCPNALIGEFGLCFLCTFLLLADVPTTRYIPPTIPLSTMTNLLSRLSPLSSLSTVLCFLSLLFLRVGPQWLGVSYQSILWF